MRNEIDHELHVFSQYAQGLVNTLTQKSESLVVVLLIMQTCSCIVKQTFSQFQLIRRSCGQRILESTLELRTLLRCQHGKGDNFEM